MTRLSRRHALLGGLTLAALAACSSKPALSDPAEPVPPIHDRIEALQGRHDAKIGVYGVDLTSGRSITYLDGELFAMCSTFKGYAVARVLQMSERGERRLDDAVRIDRADIVSNLEPVQFVPVGEIEDGSVTLGQPTGRHGDEVGQFTSRRQDFGSGVGRFEFGKHVGGFLAAPLSLVSQRLVPCD
jgi:hypothetical protein